MVGSPCCLPIIAVSIVNYSFLKKLRNWSLYFPLFISYYSGSWHLRHRAPNRCKTHSEGVLLLTCIASLDPLHCLFTELFNWTKPFLSSIHYCTLVFIIDFLVWIISFLFSALAAVSSLPSAVLKMCFVTPSTILSVSCLSPKPVALYSYSLILVYPPILFLLAYYCYYWSCQLFSLDLTVAKCYY